MSSARVCGVFVNISSFFQSCSPRRVEQQTQDSTPTRGRLAAGETKCDGARQVELKCERVAGPGRRTWQVRTYQYEQTVNAEVEPNE